MWLFRLKACLLLILIASCAFRPLYSNKNSQILDLFASIEVVDKNATDKQNIELVEQIKESLNIDNKDLTKKYILEINYRSDYSDELVVRDHVINAKRVKLNLEYLLYDVISKKKITNGKIFVTGVFDILDSELSSYNAKHYVKQNLIKEIGKNLKDSLSIVLIDMKS